MMNECKNITVPTVQGQISKELEIMDKYLSELSDSLGELQHKLLPILGDVDCSGSEKSNDLRLTKCPLAEELDSNNLRISNKIDFVNELTKRIQL